MWAGALYNNNITRYTVVNGKLPRRFRAFSLLELYMHNGYYIISGAVIFGVVCMAWGLKHINNTNRRVYTAEVGGMACVLGGIFLGLAMMSVFDIAKSDPAFAPVAASQPR